MKTLDIEEMVSIETAKGSVYRCLEDGTTQRYKAATGKTHKPQDAIVFIPDYETLSERALSSMNFEGTFGENELMYEQILLRHHRTKGKKIHIVDSDGYKLNTNEEVRKQNKQVYLRFASEDEVNFFIPVVKEPRIGFYTFDTRKFFDKEKDGWYRENHIGNKVVKINCK